jgi:glyoxylase I family protein
MSTPPTPAEPRRMQLTGLHHVTLISGDLARTTEFYSGVLGLTLVREGANDDDPGARHFWFGDAQGTPGTLVSFLEYAAMPEGTVGRGSTHHLAFSVGSAAEQDAWREWLTSKHVPSSEVLTRGGLRSLYFRDPDGHLLEITVPA